MSTQYYLVKYRLDEGARLLSETDISIKEIACQIGYENPLTFSKIFKARVGVSPQSYRQKRRS